ncbi:adenosylmethionine--8-amino-7-oxononanoate transaminase [Bartonella sp. DGB1]|uniref:adenosylmethionine--8-amino-7-oxononanoate transaminase n=1 Tax=Bartonella sp. DGB1 TaxID=3239807 RepID=UPI003524862F
MSLVQRDKNLIWHPFTQEKTAREILAITSGKGAYLYDENGKGYLDLISSWWVNLHGHAQPDIAQAIYQQSQKLEHVIFAGFTHEPAINLCDALKAMLPDQLTKFFFSDNGSTAVEVALKMSYQYWKNLGHTNKNIFVSFEGGYHGDTFGAMSVGSQSGFHDVFSDLFFKTTSIYFPATWENDPLVEEKEQKSLTQLEIYLAENHNNIAAFILEPLIQGASGMRFCRPVFLNKFINILKNYDILIIFDEIMTGFGRTGSYFAFQQLDNITPDFLCLSKGLTGGFLPLALTITNKKIYNAFLSDNINKAFLHGHSYTANPLACAAANCSLELLQQDSCQKKLLTLPELHKKGLDILCKNPKISQLRYKGTISAFNVEISVDKINQLKQQFIQASLLIRPLGKTIYLLPPYCITEKELINAYERIDEILSLI